MSQKIVLSLVPCLVFASGSTAWGQKKQPWIPLVNGAVESRILHCPVFPALPVPLNRLAFDDFKCDATGKITWVRWWGIVVPDTNLAQLTKRYYVAIWGVTQGPCPDIPGEFCDVGQLLGSWCVTPTTKYAGKDCLDRKVYRFTASLPSPPLFVQTAGTHYWLSIAEIDDESVNPGVEDFRWSSREPVTLCPAEQVTAGGIFVCPIGDDCPTPPPCDLTFELRKNCVGGVVVWVPPIIDPETLVFEFRFAGAPLNSPPIWAECEVLDDNGAYLLDPPLPDGQYNLTLVGMATPRPTRPVNLMGGVASGVDFTGLRVGDLDNNGQINGLDIPLIVDGLLNP